MFVLSLSVRLVSVSFGSLLEWTHCGQKKKKNHMQSCNVTAQLQLGLIDETQSGGWGFGGSPCL